MFFLCYLSELTLTVHQGSALLLKLASSSSLLAQPKKLARMNAVTWLHYFWIEMVNSLTLDLKLKRVLRGFCVRNLPKLLSWQPQSMKLREDFNLGPVCQGLLPSPWERVASALLKQERQACGVRGNVRRENRNSFILCLFFISMNSYMEVLDSC